MRLSYEDLEFSMNDDLLIVSYPARDVMCFCELNGDRDYIERTWVTGFDTPGRRYVASLMRSAGNAYLDGLRLVQSL